MNIRVVFSKAAVMAILLVTAIMVTGSKSSNSQSGEPEMVFVQGGTFTMGYSNEQGNERGDLEKPAQQVTVSSFYIGKYEVTQAQWMAVMGNNPSRIQGDNLPVVTVSWVDVQEYIRRLNAATGKQYRLSTEAEWEYAARGGNQSKGYRFSGSNNLNDVAWQEENSDGAPHAVGTKQPNELGIYDMSGNVAELCNNWYDSSPPVYRGGSWLGDNARQTRPSFRLYITPDRTSSAIGFRLALSSI